MLTPLVTPTEIIQAGNDDLITDAMAQPVTFKWFGNKAVDNTGEVFLWAEVIELLDGYTDYNCPKYCFNY